MRTRLVEPKHGQGKGHEGGRGREGWRVKGEGAEWVRGNGAVTQKSNSVTLLVKFKHYACAAGQSLVWFPIWTRAEGRRRGMEGAGASQNHYQLGVWKATPPPEARVRLATGAAVGYDYYFFLTTPMDWYFQCSYSILLNINIYIYWTFRIKISPCLSILVPSLVQHQ